MTNASTLNALRAATITPTAMVPWTSVEIKRMRESFSAVLGDDAKYLSVKAGQKTPISSFGPNKKNRLNTPPLKGNFGIIPVGRLVVFDFDHHEKSTIKEQMDALSTVLGVDLSTSLLVSTRSGGVHAYTRFADNVDLSAISAPGTFPLGSMRAWSAAVSDYVGNDVAMSVDVRSGLSNGYVIGPTSYVDQEDGKGHGAGGNGYYWLSRVTEIITLDPGAVARLVSLRKHSSMATPAIVGDARVSNDTGRSGVMSVEVMSLLRRGLSAREGQSFHTKRAFVKSALHCCWNDESIAFTCRQLEIDRDTHRDRELNSSELMIDLGNFKPRNRYHGAYCQQARKQRRENGNGSFETEISPEEKLELIRAKMESRTIARTSRGSRRIDPKVLDVGKIFAALMATTTRDHPTQQIRDAMSVVDYFLQPLSNAGAMRILLARDEVCRRLDLTISRATAAMRLLRGIDVLILQQKQRTGMAATYSVSDEFTHRYLSRAIRLAWGASESLSETIQHRTLFFDRHRGGFFTVFGGDRVRAIKDIGHVVSLMIANIPFLADADHGAGAASAYLREEREMIEALRLSEAISEPGMTIDPLTGEIVPQEPAQPLSRTVTVKPLADPHLSIVADAVSTSVRTGTRSIVDGTQAPAPTDSDQALSNTNIRLVG